MTALNDTLHEEYGYGQDFAFSEIGESYSGLSGKSSEDFGEGLPFITYTNIYSNDIINESDYGYVRISDGESQNRVQYGDLLFTLSSERPMEEAIARQPSPGPASLARDSSDANSRNCRPKVCRPHRHWRRKRR